MKKNQKGFTLIEIIVVIVMIGVLAAIAVPIYTGYIYKARASEGITTLGAVKTFLLERRIATGNWPEKSDIIKEFNNFNDLYYFKSAEDDIFVNYNGDKVTVRLTASDEFGLPNDFDETPTIEIHFAFEGEKEDSGWSGGIVTKYATHLPQYVP